MLAKINFPREALVVSGIYQTLFNGGIKMSVTKERLKMPTVIKNVKKSELPHNWTQSVIPGSKESYTIIIKGAKDTNAKIKGGIINELRKNKIKAFKPMTCEEIYQR